MNVLADHEGRLPRMDIKERYTGELRERFGYSATWLPTVEVRIGDVGTMSGHEFHRLGSIVDLGIELGIDLGTDLAIRPSESVATLDHMSSGSVDVTVRSATGAASARRDEQATDELLVRFSHRGAVLFHADDCRVETVDQQRALESEVLRLYAAGRWPADSVVVTEVVRASRATILVAGGSDAQIRLGGRFGTRPLELSAGAQVLMSRNIDTQVLAQGELTPLFRARGVRRRLLRTPSVVARGHDSDRGGEGDDQAFFLGEVDYEHFA